ncbi:hypothetical protein GGU11DRAFT_787619 [Lentinula aff. detonsa]|uniref:Cryptic loci regulator 2 N-terminal domain-containing protein n=1 Tax=Lentinula aff. detonsa TaxID=2804958 RepID=A0AA38KHM2_9AGAR|nr:hypothetical protein GGU10DRAFT_432802 [Lentinula aff. detonsa]KAJ3796636.1 hypothetical protein GGU11DRAFT_787619 [Lentinula aff. detonsa]
MSFAPTLEPIKIRFPRTDVLNLNAAAEMIEARSIQGAKIRIADDGYRKRWLQVILKGLCEARIFAPETAGDSELADFPEGYQLVQRARRIHQQNSHSGRWDTYLIGSPNVKAKVGFRSAREFIPHAIWLFCNPGLNHALCQCIHRRYQLNPSGDHQHLQNITNLQSQGLPFSSLDSRSSSISIDEAVHQLRETRSDSEIRKGEVIWAALNPAITDFHSRAAPNAIRLWPALVLGLTMFRSENTTIFKVQLFGLLPSQACSVQKSRILPFNAYTLPLVLTNSLRFVLQSRQAQAYPDSPELLTLNFEESDRAFPHNPSFAAAALPYIQALSEAFRHIHGRSCYRNVVLHLEMATATPNISFIPCNCMSGFQDNAESSAFQWGAEYIQDGDLVRLKTSRKDLVPFKQFLHPPSGPVQSYSQIWSPPNEKGGAFSRGLFLKIMTVQLLSPAEHPESPSTLSAVGILYEVADKDASVLGTRLAADEAHHEFEFCSIMKTGYLAVVALNDIRGRYYPAPEVISTFYNLKLESRESVTPSPSQHHLQMLAGLWPDDNFDAQIEFGGQQIVLARAGNKEEFADILNHCAAIARQKHLTFEKCIHPKTEESD